MLFSSIIFIAYFLPLVLLLYYGLCFSTPLKNGVLLVMSLCFYSWGGPRLLILMLFTILISYILGRLMEVADPFMAKIILIAGCSYYLSVLFIYKYLGFVLQTINESYEWDLAIPTIVLPLGISFFTFQALSYLVDVYKGSVRAQKNIFQLALYITFFPQLVAGPIVRYHLMDKELNHRKENWVMFSKGICRFIVGLSKKLIISNPLGLIVDEVFTKNTQGPIATTLAWLGAISYMLQIYYDFSGYSDMAIGLGQMFGFEFEENFNYPYIASSISDFWRRWHISLGQFFRDYVYIPLGGSRVATKDELIKNLFVVWLLTGIWHGAEWTFIVWGLFYFVLIVFEKTFGLDNKKTPSFGKRCYVLMSILIGWVIFRAPSLQEAGSFFNSMFSIHYFWSSEVLAWLRNEWYIFILAIAFAMPIAKPMKQTRLVKLTYPLIQIALLFLSLSILVRGGYNPFIYFNF